MANRYANLTPSAPISQEYQKITQGFDRVQNDVDNLNELKDKVDEILKGQDLDPNKDIEVLASRVSSQYGTFDTLPARLDHTDQILASFIEEVGNLEDLNTDEKSNLVGSINEVNTRVKSHLAEKVTQEQDGHMTKEDKIKLNGIEEGANKTDYYYGIAILPHDEEDKFNIGTNIYIPTVSSSDEYYIAWRAEIANILGVDDEPILPFRIVIETIKQQSFSMIQNVYVYAHYTAIIGSHLFTFHRVYGFGNNKWRDWQIKRLISLYSEGSPEGVVPGIYGALCLDILNNKLYIKKGSKKIGATNTGWELIGGA